MRLWKVGVILVVVIALIGCSRSSQQQIYYKAHKKMVEMKSYTCLATVSIPKTKGSRKYVFQQTFKYPDRYRLEILSPETLKGNLTIYNGHTAWIQHIAIDQVWKMDSFEGSKEQMMFVGYFLKNFVNSEEGNLYSENLEGKECIVITTQLPGGKPYFTNQKLWLDKKALIPLQLQIIDNNDNVVFQVEYGNFEYNVEVEDQLFYLEEKENKKNPR